MHKQISCLALWLVLLYGTVYAAETTASLELIDVGNQQQIKGVIASITLAKDGHVASQFRKYLASNIVEFDVEEGTYLVSMEIDDLETEGKDYYLSETIDLAQDVSAKVYLYGTGSISGSVIDQLNNLISNADLKFECAADYGDQRPEKTDKYGSFSIQYAPVGKCKITAYKSSMVGSETIDLKRGQKVEVQVNLKQKTATTNFWPYVFIAALLVAILVFVFFRKNKPKIIKEDSKAKPEVTKRTSDVLKTLKEKERKIVEAIMESGNESTQAKLKSATGIPKTSLSRTLESLAAKKILEVESYGKMKKVRLTDWFLEKEN